MAEVFTKDGRYYDAEGFEMALVGNEFQPLLRRSLEAEAEFKRKRAEQAEAARRRSDTTSTKEWKKKQDEVSEKRRRISALREQIHHLACRKCHYVTVQDAEVFSLWLADAEQAILDAIKHRNELLHQFDIADDMITNIDDLVRSADDEITRLQDEIEQELAKPKEESVESKPRKSKVESLLSKIDPRVIEQWKAAGLYDKAVAALSA